MPTHNKTDTALLQNEKEQKKKKNQANKQKPRGESTGLYNTEFIPLGEQPLIL